MRTVYLNNKFVSEIEAKISIFDRGFLFGDAVYEVTTVIGGKLLDWYAHVGRLEKSLEKIYMVMPLKSEELLSIHKELIQKNSLSEGLVYMQISRGVFDREFLIEEGQPPTVIIFTQEIDLLNNNRLNRGLRIMSTPDIRWDRRDIKTVQLLASSLMKTSAKKKGMDDAWFVEGGYVTEGTSSNAFIIDKNGTIISRNVSNFILPGITRAALIVIIQDLNLGLEERPFTIKEAQEAKEAFITSASNFIVSVIEIDGHVIGDGKIGETTRRLRDIYLTQAIKSAL